MPRVYLSLGSNCRREASLRSALALLRREFPGLDCSPVYESEAEGAPGGPYLNLVVGLESGLPVHDLKARLREMEAGLGRERGRPEVVIDIDILLVEGLCGSFDGLELPRPELLQRAYVLKPLSDLAGSERHPLTGRTFREHWRDFLPPARLHPVELPETGHV
jgi:2-amino-4-hydroxy-6-hydroxymethyldihydropteridine diphosphokinase